MKINIKEHTYLAIVLFLFGIPIYKIGQEVAFGLYMALSFITCTGLPVWRSRVVLRISGQIEINPITEKAYNDFTVYFLFAFGLSYIGYLFWHAVTWLF